MLRRKCVGQESVELVLREEERLQREGFMGKGFEPGVNSEGVMDSKISESIEEEKTDVGGGQSEVKRLV